MMASHAGFGLWLEHGPPRVRDPEYGKRLAHLQERVAEDPGRPLVLVIGSSRAAMGVRPGVLEPSPDRPFLFNFSLAGSGPIMELMAFRRALADGVKPDAVLIEYWPAFVMEAGPYHEAVRFDPSRVRDVDARSIREFFPDPDGTDRAVARLKWNPVYGHRRSLVNQLIPSWLPNAVRSDAMWTSIDDWGWLPGRVSATADEIAKGRAGIASYYVPLFAQYEVSPIADHALRQLVAECRAAGVSVALLYLPESPVFRENMTPAAITASTEYLARVRTELNLPLIDARDWAPDTDLPDGFHLTQSGASTFTRKLAPAIGATFPEVSRRAR